LEPWLSDSLVHSAPVSFMRAWTPHGTWKRNFWRLVLLVSTLRRRHKEHECESRNAAIKLTLFCIFYVDKVFRLWVCERVYHCTVYGQAWSCDRCCEGTPRLFVGDRSQYWRFSIGRNFIWREQTRRQLPVLISKRWTVIAGGEAILARTLSNFTPD